MSFHSKDNVLNVLISYIELKVTPTLFYFLSLPNLFLNEKESLFQKAICLSGNAKDLLIPFWAVLFLTYRPPL